MNRAKGKHSINKFLIFFLRYLLPGIVIFLMGFIANIYFESIKTNKERDKKVWQSDTIFDSLNKNIEESKSEIRDINKRIGTTERKIDKIGDCINREIIPTLNNIRKGTISSIELKEISMKIDKYYEYFAKYRIDFVEAHEAKVQKVSPDSSPEMIIFGTLVPLDKVDIAPKIIKRVEPEYPPLAKKRGIKATVKLNALISETGDVIRVEILKKADGEYGFEESSKKAVLKWKFKPAQKNSVFVKVWQPISITFK